MEILGGLLIISLLFAVIVVPIVILVQLSSIKSTISELVRENKRLRSMLQNTVSEEAEEQRPELRDQRAEVRSPIFVPQAELPRDKQESDVPIATEIPQPPPLPATEQKKPVPLQKKPVPAKAEQKPEAKSPKPVSGAAGILRKIWRWILVGEEYQHKGISAESAIASTWMMRVGIIFLAGLAAYFLKWSMERELIGPAGRFAIGIGFGITMLLCGIKLIKTRYRIIGEGLLGGSTVVLYLCLYAADAMYHLMPTPLAFGLMVVVTVTAGILAVRLDSMLVAIFGIIGGYLTPIALSTAVLSLPGFYTYILILSIAVLAIALSKQWRLLNYLGFILTYGLYFLHSMEHYNNATDFPVAITFLTLLFVVQSLTVCIHNIIRKQQSTMAEAVHLILNALIYSVGGYYLIIEAHGRPWPSIMSIWLALFYLLYIAMFLRRGLKDRLLLLCLISLAAAHTAWTLPLVFEKESLTIAFALLAFVFLWLGRKVKSNFLQTLSYFVYAFVFFRIAAMDMPEHYSLKAPEISDWSTYFKGILDRLFTFGISIGSITGAFLLSRTKTRESDIIFPENDIKTALPASKARSILFWASVVFVFLFLQLEFNTMFYCWEPIRRPFQTLLWGVLILFLFSRLRISSAQDKGMTFLKAIVIAVLAIALGKLILIDTQAWNLSLNFIYDKDYILLGTFMRFIDFGIMLTVLLLAWQMINRGRIKLLSSTQFGYTALALFFFYCTLELRTLLYWKLETFLPAGISILWAVFAVSFILFGISRNKGSLRATGLVLFVVVCAKVVLSDLRDLPIIYRIIALLVIATTLLLGSFAYLKSGSAEGGNDKLMNDS